MLGQPNIRKHGAHAPLDRLHHAPVGRRNASLKNQSQPWRGDGAVAAPHAPRGALAPVLPSPAPRMQPPHADSAYAQRALRAHARRATRELNWCPPVWGRARKRRSGRAAVIGRQTYTCYSTQRSCQTCIVSSQYASQELMCSHCCSTFSESCDQGLATWGAIARVFALARRQGYCCTMLMRLSSRAALLISRRGSRGSHLALRVLSRAALND